MHRALLATSRGRAFAAAGLGLCLLTLIGLVALWPSGERASELAGGLRPNADRAVVLDRVGVDCLRRTAEDCYRLRVALEEGQFTGGTATFVVGENGYAPELARGDTVRVLRQATQAGSPGGLESYGLADVERGSSLLLLTLLFAAVVIALGRWRGLRALIGLGASLALVVSFVLPALLAGSSPVLVALVGSVAIMLVTLVLAHGTGATAISAGLGTAAALLLTLVLAVVAVRAAQLSGLTGEEARVLRLTSPGLSLQGLLLAGMVIAALGVLDDVTVTQASTVLALKASDGGLGVRELYTRAMDVGRDHVSAAVNTLVLAYVGVSLPILLVFSAGGELGSLVSREAFAESVVATLVGSIGLMAAVPLTTLLASVLATDLDGAALDAEHGHHH